MGRLKFKFSTTQMIAGGFLIAIIIGALLLMLPVSSASGEATFWVDALFTSTTSVCVTGLTTVTTAAHWSLFGKIVILVLIQFGGLGIVTITTSFLIVAHRRLTLKDRLLLMDAYNLSTLKGLVTLTKKIIAGALLVEGAGALLYSFKLVPVYGLVKGAAMSVFTSVSAFCNAGIDLFGADSLAPFRGSALMNFTTMALIIIAGIGFPVWWDTLRVIREKKEHKWSLRKALSKFSLHSKMALCMTAVLVLGGALLIFLFEYQNPETMAGESLWQRFMDSMFQSVTTRTAGFFTIDQTKFTNASSVLSVLLMFIGGSPSGTAGGIKTVTVLVLLMSVYSIVRGRNDVDIFRRKVSDFYVKKALAVFTISLLTAFASVMFLSITEDAEFLQIVYECTSAIGTVGLTRGLTPHLTIPGKLIIIFTMYLGRIGPITMALALNGKKKNIENYRTLPEEDVTIG